MDIEVVSPYKQTGKLTLLLPMITVKLFLKMDIDKTAVILLTFEEGGFTIE